MYNKITMEMLICQATNEFFWDDLVKKVAVSYKKKVFSEILKMNL